MINLSLLASGGFNLRKWCSNELTLLEPLFEKTTDPHICLNNSKTHKTLGIHWNPHDDSLVHIVRDFNPAQRITKRNMLSQIASLFDSWIVGPVIVRAKIMLQQLWKIKLDWDESVPAGIATSWNKYIRQFATLTSFVPRQIIGENATHIQLHGFCDASEGAYGAVLYLRSTTSQGTHVVRLICSRTRVAPIKNLSLPRLELCAAVLLGRLYEAISRALRIDFGRIYF